MATTTRTIAIPQQLDPVTVLGPVDEVLREVERAFPDLTIIVRGNRIAIMSRSSKSESQAVQAEHVIENIIQAAYTAPMDADTVRRMLDQNVLKNPRAPRYIARATARVRGGTTAGRSTATRTQPMHVLPRLPRRDRTASRTVPGVITFAARRAGACENGRSEWHIRERHRIAHHHLRHRPGRHRQDVPGRGEGGARLPGQAGAPHHPDAARPWRRAKASAFCPAR